MNIKERGCNGCAHRYRDDSKCWLMKMEEGIWCVAKLMNVNECRWRYMMVSLAKVNEYGFR